MSETTRRLLAVPIIIIVLGLSWLLMAAGVGERIDWTEVSALALVGIISWLLSGVNKFTVVVVPWFLLASFSSWLHDMALLSTRMAVPVLFIAFGLLVLLAVLLPVPRPGFMVNHDPRDDV